MSSKRVRVKTTWASRARIENDPPPEPNSLERSTLAIPSATVRSNRRVPSGMAVDRAGTDSLQPGSGPCSSQTMAWWAGSVSGAERMAVVQAAGTRWGPGTKNVLSLSISM